MPAGHSLGAFRSNEKCSLPLPPLSRGQSELYNSASFVLFPGEYHGLDLVDWTVEKLAADVFLMLLHLHWDDDSILGRCLRCAYELLQMETGLEGRRQYLCTWLL